MALAVVKFENNVVTVESDMDGSRGREFSLAHAELGSMEARRLAEQHAAKHGVASPGLGLPTSPYPVDAQGELIESQADTNKLHRFRIDVPIQPRV